MTLLEELKSYLLELGCRPGEKIPTEMELAAHFKVSRGKVREATTALCLQGMLDKKARRGTVIKSLDPDSAGSDLLFRFSLSDIDPADFKEARRVIERAIMPLSVRRITPVLLRELEVLVERMEDRSMTPEVADAADRDFHLVLLKACGNRTLQTFGQVIQALFREQYRRQYRTPELLERAAAAHRRLLTALKNSDEAAAVELIANHIRD
jgi:Transcriptional regulators